MCRGERATLRDLVLRLSAGRRLLSDLDSPSHGAPHSSTRLASTALSASDTTAPPPAPAAEPASRLLPLSSPAFPSLSSALRLRLPSQHSTMSRPFFDRTSEFRSAVESAAFRAASSSSAAGGAGAPLVPQGAGPAQGGKNAQRSEFARMAAKIGKDIQGTTGKLEKLAQRASPSSSSWLHA